MDITNTFFNAKAIKKLLEKDPRAISRHMNTSLATSRKYFEYIENAANSTISNVRLEGVNNLIKTIKRISFGIGISITSETGL